MNKKSYVWDMTDVNLSSLKKQGWNSIKNSPSPNSYKEVLLIKSKHGGDLECVAADWIPLNQYTEGQFSIKGHEVDIASIYLWRTLDFLMEENNE